MSFVAEMEVSSLECQNASESSIAWATFSKHARCMSRGGLGQLGMVSKLTSLTAGFGWPEESRDEVRCGGDGAWLVHDECDLD